MRQQSITMSKLQGLLRRDTRITIATLSQVAGIPLSNLSAALRDPNLVYLGSEKESELWSLAQRCVEVIDALLPLQIPRGDGATLRLLVRSGRDPEAIRNNILNLLEPVE